MERSRWAVLTAGVALAVAGTNGTVAFAQTAKPGQAQQAGQTTQKPAQAAPQNDNSSMVKPPEAASGSGGSSNPDNMPIKRPTKPTNDRMTHEPPASGANAK
ncbi:hypothetical protein [Paraburkholderia sediminicola]|uniref:hypothetical protein n=1 Tax=Paraburkholderia sediminicola TaxID=458836 RepID=UPI0038BC35DC